MGLFDKKYCDICGEKIGLLGNRKLEDGNLCKDCAKKLSPFFSERRKSTVEDIRMQLASREENSRLLQSFNPTSVLGFSTKVYIDPQMGKFAVSRRSDYRAENADLIDLSAVTNARYEVQEHRSELYAKDAEGNRVSYTPPRYEYSYELKLYIDVNHPYISEISFEVTDHRPDSRYSDAFRQYEQAANEIVCALRGMPVAPGTDGAGIPYNQNPMFLGGIPGSVAYQNIAAQQQPVYPQDTIFPAGYQPGDPQQPDVQQPAQQSGGWFCPSCGTPNSGNFCMNCGTPKPQM